MRIAILLGVIFTGIAIILAAMRSRRDKNLGPATNSHLIGADGRALENFSKTGMITVGGETWRARLASGAVAKGEVVVIVRMLDALELEVVKK